MIPIELVHIPGQGEVRPFLMGKYPVTNTQYAAYLLANPHTKFHTSAEVLLQRPFVPASNIAYHDAQGFCEWARLRLPTDEEWCLAAGSIPQTDEQMLEHAWCSENSGGVAMIPGQKRPNQHGLYDMFGNVWEWMSIGSGWSRGLRGGSWDSSAGNIRAALRLNLVLVYQNVSFGFRCASHQDQQTPRAPPSEFFRFGLIE